MTHELHDRGDARRADAHCEVAFIPRIARNVCVLGHAAIDCPGPRASPRRAIDPRKHDVSSAPRFDRGTAHRRIRRTTLRNRNRAAVRHAFPLIRSTDDPACKPPFDDDRRPRISPRAEPVQTQAPARTRAAQGARIRDRAHRERKGSGDTRALATSTAGCCRLPKTGIARRCATEKEKVHRRKPWRLGERLRNLTPDFMDVRRRNCSIARHFRH
ncbi:Uncharacterised protein [Burkholderia mallei]|uniref:hypothetical protein n=1 Tax=Burkholderia mallei TaxID=13373 RepID=UPI0004F719CC|nr:hypothetical protein [Burkholderia mallei]AIO52606.1 deoxyribodipyrimidine photolyase domain protein [Burkholderia mallei]AIO61848.1 deoxyribodipyrimidine photolyase domain protein [Burkholderia mallei]SQA70234.1 Uncharacterised protein [Burkholderia mallei]